MAYSCSWRTAEQGGHIVEADIVFESGTKLQPVEIKSGQTITSDYIRAGLRAGRFAEEEALQPWLIYGGDDSYERKGVTIMSWRDCAKWSCVQRILKLNRQERGS